MSENFLGTGWGFPLLPDPAGGLRYAVGEDEHPGLPAGAAADRGRRAGNATRLRHQRAHSWCSRPAARRTCGSLESSISDAVRTFEPRVELDAVLAEPTPGAENRVVVSVTYRVRRTNTKANLVFPYYLDTVGG